MPQETLRNHPLWRAEDLGQPVPNTTHAISMCLPRWRDVVGYEEQDPATMARLRLGYPRFFYHPLVAQAFAKFAGEGECVQIYPTRRTAERCLDYLLGQHPEARIKLRGTLIAYPAECAADAKDYWQHAGEGISSRCAEALLNDTPPPAAAAATAARDEILERLARFTGAATADIYLFPSGMAAINAAHLAVQEIHPGRATVQFAFPYGDTLKLQNKFGSQPAWFYARGDCADLAALEARLAADRVGGLFCEFPTNPLLTCVDLPALRALANEHDFPILIDETLGACINQNTLPYSDVSAISLTKYFSGAGDVMGGALIINSNAPFAARFREQLEQLHEPEAFHPADVIQLAKESANCRERVEQINRTALEVAEFLAGHPAVESVYYPALTDPHAYDRV
uniref:aminotransferase class I/II-fold pyridoxal phosphate-dependent enzyme n=1 Tax=Pontiella sp. TaxID=2837462 RepID=UPI003567E02E